jgi:hypothetical protein
VRIAAGIIGATVLSYMLGWLLGVPAIVPVLNTVAAYPFMVGPVRDGRLASAIARMLLWAATMGVCATALAYARPAVTSQLFVNAVAYEREMFAWFDTGQGRESRPRELIPQHVAHAALFSALSLATGSALSMPFGAVLMNYMGHYVGALANRYSSPSLLAAGWHPWALVRVTSFVVLGVVLSGPVLCRASGKRWQWTGAVRWWLGAALAGLVIDLGLKALLAPMWRQLLISLAAK